MNYHAYTAAHRLAQAFSSAQDRIDALEETLREGEQLVQNLLAALRVSLDRIDALKAENVELKQEIDLVTDREREGRELA